MDTFPDAMLEISSGIIRGFSLPGPFVSRISQDFSTTCMLPMPLPTLHPTRKGSSFVISRPDCSMASFAAATAYWLKSSIRLADLKSM